MRNFLFIGLFLLIGAVAYMVSTTTSRTSREVVQPVIAGGLAPAFQLEDTNGNQVSLSDLRGKVVLVNFWATWCPPCIEEMPSMEMLNKVMAGYDFVMLAINTEENGRSAVADFLKKTPYNFPVLYDDKGVVQKRYGVFKFPESFIVGKDGIVAEKIIGPLDWSSPRTIAHLKNLARR